MFTTRVAAREDAPAILELIKELALYEKEPDKVVCTPDDIIRDGFGDKPFFECLLVECEGQPVAFALYFFKWSTWTGSAGLHLEDLYVKPAMRGKQIGYNLMKRLAQIAVERKCDRFEWDVLDWNTPALDFYKSLGAVTKDGWLTCRMDGEALQKLGTAP